jgi:hypothetical protein
MPPGLQVTLDGQPAVTPITVSSVVGILRTLGALSPQSVPPSVYHFESWSDGGAASHTVTTPSTSGTYVVAYQTNPRPPTNLRIQQ